MCIASSIIDFIWSKEFLHDVIGSALGFVVGVLWAEWKYRRDRAEQSKVFRSNLIKGFQFNLVRIKDCLSFLGKTPPQIPNFRMDTSSVGHILFTGRDLFAEGTLFDRFNWQRYQLEHINAKLDYIHIYITSADSGRKAIAFTELASLVGHLKITQKEIVDLISEYEKSI